MNFKNILIIFIVTSGSFTCMAQNTPQEEAMQLFREGRYDEALPIYKRLITLFPRDPRYQYYTGVCMVQTNTDLTKAIDYLKFAEDKPVPRDVFFFLGKAFHDLYRFDDALDAYLQFQQFGERAEKEKWQCDMNINMARNGKRLLEHQTAFDVYKVETINKNDLYSYYNKQIKSGKFQEITENTFFGAPKVQTWRFMPSFLANDQEIYQSAPKNFKKDLDIVKVKKQEDGTWSKPQNLGSIINSPFDEDYAYFNIAESTLYFSSKGHNSMGGYDIFKSIFNPNTETWSEPINLGFPINSPYDDFLFVPSDDQSVAWFVSNRETKGDQLMVYSISFSKEFQVTGIGSGTDYISKSHLSVSTAKPSATKFPVNSGSGKQSQPVIYHKNASSTDNTYPSELIEQKEYNQVLNAALQYQLQSDSLGRVVEDIRQQMLLSKNESEKTKNKRDIYLLEQRSKTAQQKADELYEKARAFEIAYAGKTPATSETPRVTGEMAKQAFSKHEKENTVPSNEIKQKKTKSGKSTKETSKPAAKPLVYEFKIMNKTPYKSTGDIPINQPLPDGLIYRIQMGAFSKTIEPDRFKGIAPIHGETIQNSSITKYYAGLFSKMSDVEKALIKIHEYGFKDAYIVSFFNGRSIPINRAKELEKDN